MSTSSDLHPLFSSFLSHGKSLAILLHSVKNKQNYQHKNIHEKVRDIVTKLLDDFNRVKDSATFPEETLANVLGKIEETLLKFIKIDPNNASIYEDLSKRVKDFTKSQKSSQPELPVVSCSSPGYDISSNYQVSSVNNYLQEEFDFEEAYANLDEKEKQCLLCFTLFTPGVEIKKIHLIHWWVGMDLIDPSIDDVLTEELLDKFVAEGLIERSIRNKKMSNRYKIHNAVHSKVEGKMESIKFRKLTAQEGALSMIHRQYNAEEAGAIRKPVSFVFRFTLSMITEEEKMLADVADKIEALNKVSKFMLNAKTFYLLSRMKNVKVLHLGLWQQDSNHDILIDDDELLKHLKNLEQLRFLNLQGISGIVRLSDTVCKLKNLKVLDLRACHNLEFLPEGIDSLQELAYIDLSECYLLDHIPKGFASLTKLKVLKGFIINADQNQEAESYLQGGSSVHGDPKFASICEFKSLSELKSLRKLTIHTRRLNFPTEEDLQTLHKMHQLCNLRIKWVGSSKEEQIDENYLSNLPLTLKKLELQAAPESKASTLLGLISKHLEKLYIRGGGLALLVPFRFQVKEVRLRYLPNLEVNWDEFLQSFPNLIRLEIFECPNLMFPCDENGIWER